MASVIQLIIENPKFIFWALLGVLVLVFGVTAFVTIFKLLRTDVFGIPIGAIAVVVIFVMLLMNRQRV